MYLSKLRNKSHDEIRYYKGLVRDLQKQVRQLQKQLKYYDKRHHLIEDNAVELQELKDKSDEIPEIARKIKCVSCDIGHYDEFHLLDRLYGTCDNCGLRKRLV